MYPAFDVLCFRCISISMFSIFAKVKIADFKIHRKHTTSSDIQIINPVCPSRVGPSGVGPSG